MRTPLYELHKQLKAKIVDFHGWEMPLQYSGIIDEHKNVRSNVGLFDVSHMGRFKITGSKAENCIQNLLTNDISKLDDMKALYSPMCLENGGIVDDVIIYRINQEDFLMVVNSSNRQKDFEWITSHSQAATIKDVSQEMLLLALQGPLAQKVLEDEIDLDKLKPFHLTKAMLFNEDCIVARTGYTGEDGFEIFFDSSKIHIWEKLLKVGSKFSIKPVGLGARDTLRIEAGLMLYGNDIDENVTPLEAPLKWTVKFEKNFIGKKALEQQKISRILKGFEILGTNRIARKGNLVLSDSSVVGVVTSGSFSPTLGKSIGFCFLPPEFTLEQPIQIDIRGKIYDAKVTRTRFYKRKQDFLPK